MAKPNIVFLLTDQWRLQALGYAGNTQVQTPHIDRLAHQSVNFTHAVSGWPVCCPWRGSFLTGQYPLTHGVFVNDVPLSDEAVGLGEAFAQNDYDTGYIGKWHVDGQGRSSYIPPERRQGFDYWKVLECTHDYNQSAYYAGDSDEKQFWEGYDVTAQTRDAQQYIQDHANGDKPFMLVVSWGPPHNPYQTAPENFRQMYKPEDIQLRPNVPPEEADEAREWLAGYYAHCSAIDFHVGEIMQTLEDTNIADDTILIFTSDHGDMLGSQGEQRKQRPWEESIRVPLLVRHPQYKAGETDALINAHDIMPTLLGMCDLPIPETVEGRDFTLALSGESDPSNGVAILACFHPFGEYASSGGGREFRGVRTKRYTYVRTLKDPWLLYDNEKDPYQQKNLIDDPAYDDIRADLEEKLQHQLETLNDDFEEGLTYIRRWGYEVDETGTVPYTW